MVEIIFLGGGGGRWETILQNKGTGGFRVHTERTKLHVDPGPGSLIRMKEADINPWDTNALFISHCHPDHYTDGEVIVEAITKGMTMKKGYLIGSLSVIEGFGSFENSISKYHQSKLKNVYVLNPKDSVSIYDITLKGTKTKHGDPFGIGVRISTDKGDIGYTSDTEYINSLVDDFDGVDVFIANVVRKKGERIKGHLCSNDLIDIIHSMNRKPKVVVITHTGLKMTEPQKECNYISEKTGLDVKFAKVGLTIKL